MHSNKNNIKSFKIYEKTVKNSFVAKVKDIFAVKESALSNTSVARNPAHYRVARNIAYLTPPISQAVNFPGQILHYYLGKTWMKK